MKETEAVFQTAYHLAKKNRPFSDHESLIELQGLNGIKMGLILHFCYSYTNVTLVLNVNFSKENENYTSSKS